MKMLKFGFECSWLLVFNVIKIDRKLSKKRRDEGESDGFKLDWMDVVWDVNRIWELRCYWSGKWKYLAEG